MLSISRMAGQSRVESPENYYSHMGELAKTYTFCLSSLRLREVNIEKQLPAGIFGYRSKAYFRGKQYSEAELKEYRQVDYGRCLDKQFPENCIEDCRQCNFFAFSPSVNDYEKGVKWLEDHSRILEQRINEQVEIMKVICNKTTSINQKEVEQDLRHSSRNLQHYMDQKVKIDILLLENEVDDRYDHT